MVFTQLNAVMIFGHARSLTGTAQMW